MVDEGHTAGDMAILVVDLRDRSKIMTFRFAVMIGPTSAPIVVAPVRIIIVVVVIVDVDDASVGNVHAREVVSAAPVPRDVRLSWTKWEPSHSGTK